ncbi:MAG: GNAT family N-acetyltransferase [Ruminococcaceae bacterium]|nr:GNAT family N-acetyltransferase [Oscillospiraceae bacterium]
MAIHIGAKCFDRQNTLTKEFSGGMISLILYERSNTVVRKATINDISAVAVIYREQFREMSKLIPDFIKEGDQRVDFIEKTISEEDSDILVYEHNGVVIGFILLQAKIRPDFDFIIPGKYCYIMDIIVTESHRGKGFGTALMNSAMEWAKEHGCSFINLDVLVKNEGAIALYEKLGFVPKAQEMYCRF